MRHAIVIATCLGVPACAESHALRYAGDSVLVSDDDVPQVADARRGQAIALGRDETLVVKLDGRRDLIAGPLLVTRESGALHVAEPLGEHSYPDASLRGLSYQRVNTPATIALVTLSAAAGVALSVLWIHAMDHLGEL